MRPWERQRGDRQTNRVGANTETVTYTETYTETESEKGQAEASRSERLPGGHLPHHGYLRANANQLPNRLHSRQRVRHIHTHRETHTHTQRERERERERDLHSAGTQPLLARHHLPLLGSRSPTAPVDRRWRPPPTHNSPVRQSKTET